jgi:hypothetical protein
MIGICGFLFGDEDISGTDERSDIADTGTIVHQERSATRAMIYSAIFPGAGQFYVNRRSVRAYIFPVIEIGLLYFFFDYRNKGDKATDAFEAFADEHYDLERQLLVQSHWLEAIRPHNPNFTGSHFRLCRSDKQHYFEDLGKYDRYIFGWPDWFEKYVDFDGSNIVNVLWEFGEFTQGAQTTWLGNRPISNPDQPHFDEPFSELREQYRGMRKTANNHYATSRTMSYLLMANHAISAIDANMMARRNNNPIRKQTVTSFNPVIRTNFANSRPVYMFGLNMTF